MLTINDIYKLDPNATETLLLINEFVSELIPIFHSSPYMIKKEDTVESLYKRFKNREIGGWCGISTLYMLMLLDKCGIPAYEYNYGLRKTEFTHTVIIANDYLLDPYFNKYYVDKTGQLIKFEALLKMIADRDFSFSSIYGTSGKIKRIDKAEKYSYISLTSQEWERSLMDSWKQKSLCEAIKLEFNDDNPHLLMLNDINKKQNLSPFPFIKEIKDIEYIKGFNDLLKVLGMVYTTVPWFVEPYEKTIQYGDIKSLYNEFKKLKLGGWCGLNAEFFKWIIEGYRRKDLTIRYRSYNFGLPNSDITHIGVLVEIDRMEFFFDPYFARYFIHSDGYPLQFKDLLYLVGERKFNRYKSVFLPLKKPIVRENGLIEYITPQQLMKEVFDFFNTKNLPKYLKEIFGTENPDSLMLIKLP